MSLAEQLEATASTRWTNQWKELKAEVIDTGLCTGCAGCVISCPHDVIGYDHSQGGYKPFHLEEELGAANCVHGFGEGGVAAGVVGRGVQRQAPGR